MSCKSRINQCYQICQQVLGTILSSSHYAARPILALCMHWHCAHQPMRILPSWLVKEYCHAVLRIRICIKSDNTDLSGFTSFRDNTVILALRMHCRCAPHPHIMHEWALRAPTDENFIFLIGKGILQCSIAYPDLHQIKRNDTHQSAISGEHPRKTSGLKRSFSETSRRPRREAGIGRSGIKKAQT